MIQGLGNDFTAEVKSKQDLLDVTQVHLRAATRELSETRRQIQHWQARCGELDQTAQRVRNLERALTDEDNFDWTGRTEWDGSDAGPSAGPAFQVRGQGSTMSGVGGTVDMPANLEVDHLVRRIFSWQTHGTCEAASSKRNQERALRHSHQRLDAYF